MLQTRRKELLGELMLNSKILQSLIEKNNLILLVNEQQNVSGNVTREQLTFSAPNPDEE